MDKRYKVLLVDLDEWEVEVEARSPAAAKAAARKLAERFDNPHAHTDRVEEV